MASIKKIDGKTGISYKITVTKGRDGNGKQIRHFKTWTPEQPMTARKMEKEAQRVALEFEREIELGYQADNRQTFEQYARYVLELKERQGIAKNTLAMYQKFKRKVTPFIGHLKLSEVRPQHINALYRELEKPEAREIFDTVKQRVDLGEIIAEIGSNKTAFAQKCGLYDQMIHRVCNGKGIQRESAVRIAEALNMPLEDLFRDAHRPSELSPNTIRRLHAFLSGVFAQAEKEMLIPYNPVKRATPPAAVEREPDYFQPEELTRILEALESEDIKHRTMVHLFIVTGCRRGEIAGLKWGKVDFESAQIKVDNCLSYLPKVGLYEGPTKSRNTRFVALPVETIALLKKYRAWQAEQRLKMGDLWHDTGYVFTRNNGEPMSPYTIAAWLRDFSKRHELPHIHPHAFRHSVASVLISEGVDVVTVSKMLGHSKTSITTDVYSHIIEESKRKATECIADVMLRKKKA